MTRESTNVIKRAARSSRAIVVIPESGDTSSELVGTRRPSLRWMRRRLVFHRTTILRAAAQTGVSSTGTAQATSGTISTLMEDQAHSGWLCALVTDATDTQLRRNDFVELLVDTGASSTCGRLDFTHAKLFSGPRPAPQDRNR